MTYALNLDTARPASPFARIREGLAAYRAYAATKTELAGLNARNLADIGLTEADIERVARASAFR
jgi:uncharacterized protein YjiS (DUF1127 family)